MESDTFIPDNEIEVNISCPEGRFDRLTPKQYEAIGWVKK